MRSSSVMSSSSMVMVTRCMGRPPGHVPCRAGFVPVHDICACGGFSRFSCDRRDRNRPQDRRTARKKSAKGVGPPGWGHPDGPPQIDAGVDGGRFARRSKSVRSGLGRHGIERFFFFVRGRLLRPLVRWSRRPPNGFKGHDLNVTRRIRARFPANRRGKHVDRGENGAESLRPPPVPRSASYSHG